MASEKEEDLHRAVEDSNITLTLDLLDNGIDVNSKDKDGKTALFIAAKKGQANMVSILLSHGAVVNTKCNNGKTPLYEACKDGHEHVVRKLLEHKADVNMPNKSGETPLYAATWKQSQSLITLLIDSGAHVNTPDNYGDTPLHKACQFGSEHVVQELVKHNADANMANKRDQTPLHVALKRSGNSLAQRLVDSGAEINLVDKNGDTLLHRAVSCHEKEKVLILLQLGANVDILNKKGETALDIAVKHKVTEIEAILENRMEKTTRDQSFKENHEDATALLSRLKTLERSKNLDLPQNSAIFAKIQSRVSSLQELIHQETKYRQVILTNLLVEASRIIYIIIGTQLKKLNHSYKVTVIKWEELEELLDSGYSETEVEDLEQKLKLLESNVIKARGMNTEFLPEMEQIMEDLQTSFAEMKRVTPRVENLKNVKELDSLIKIMNFELSKDIFISDRWSYKLKKKRNYINFQWEKFKKFEEILQDKINSVEKLQKELDSINIEINPQDHGSLIKDLEGQEKRTELFQATLSELEKRLQKITDSLNQSSLPEQEFIETLKSEIITLKSDMLKCFGQITGNSSKFMELDQFQNRLNEITRNFINGVDGIEKCELKLKELNDDILKSIVMASEMTTSHPLITQTEKEKEEDDDAQSDKNGKKGDRHQQTKNKINCVENKNTKGKDKTHGKKREVQEEDEGKGPSMKRSKQEQESLNRKLLMNAREGNADQVGTLIENGANPNVQDENGRTPLMLAVIYGHKQFVKELLRLRAEGKTKISTNKTDNEGNTALHYCVLHERKSIVGLLVQNMNFLNHENDDGKTPRDIAEQLESKEILDMFNCFNNKEQTQKLLQNFKATNEIKNFNTMNVFNFTLSSISSPRATTINNVSVNSASNNIGNSSGSQNVNFS